MADKLSELYVQLVAKGLSDVQSALEAVKTGLDSADTLAEGARAAFEQMGARAKGYIEGLGAELVNVKGRLAGLKEAVGTGVFDQFAESMAKLKREVDFAERLTDLKAKLAGLEGSIHPNLFDQFRENLKGMAQALEDGDYEQYRVSLQKLGDELDVAGKATAAREALERMQGALHSDVVTKYGEELRKLGDAEAVTRGVAAARAQLQSLQDSLAPDTYAEFAKRLQEIRLELSAGSGDKLAGSLALLRRELDMADQLKATREEVSQLQSLVGSGATGRFAVDMSGLKEAKAALAGFQDAEVRVSALLGRVDLDEWKALQDQIAAVRTQVTSGDWAGAAENLARLGRALDMGEQIRGTREKLDALKADLLSGATADFQIKMAGMGGEGKALEGVRNIETRLIVTAPKLPLDELDQMADRLSELRDLLKAGDWDKAVAGAQQLGRALDQSDKLRATREEIDALKADVASGAAGKFAFQIGGLDKQKEALSGFGAASAQLGRLKDAIPAGEFARLQAQLEGVRKQIGGIGTDGAALAGLKQVQQGLDFGNKWAAAREEVTRLGQALASGEYQKQASAMAELGRQMDGLKKQAAWQDLVAQQGLFGASLTAVGAKLRGLADATQQVASGMQAGFQRAAGIVSNLSASFQGLTGSVTGWVKSGLQGTAQGNMIAIQMQMISREIAGIFLPIINRVIDGLQQLTAWFRSLSGAQQDQIFHWVAAGAAALVVANILPRIAGIITGALMPAFRSLVVLMTGGAASIGTALGIATGGLSTLLGLAVSLGAGLAVGTEGGRSALAGLADSFRPLLEAIKTIWEELTARLAPAFDAIGAAAGRIFAALGASLVEVFQAAVPYIERFADYVADLVTSALPQLEDFLANNLGPALRAAGAVMQWFGNLAVTVWGAVRDAFKTVVNAMIEGLATLAQHLAEAAEFFKADKLLGIDTGAMKAFAEELRGLKFSFGEAALPKVPEARPPGSPGEGDHRRVTQAGGQFEGLTTLFNRLQSEALRTTTKSAEVKEIEKTNKAIDRSNALLAAIERAMKGKGGTGGIAAGVAAAAMPGASGGGLAGALAAALRRLGAA